jgi:hypothetical protein
MPQRCPEFDEVWPPIAADQEGILSRRQLIQAGLPSGVAKREIVARRWRRLYAGVYATFTGPVSDHAQIWAALLRSGSGAAAGHRTALWLWGVINERPDVIDVAIPHDRRVERVAGLRLRRMRGLTQLVHPVALPPRLRVEAAVLAATDCALTAGTVVDLTLRATQRRVTTAPRLLAALGAWPRHRWRALLAEILSDAADGAASALELRYFRDVERAHGLPRGRRNAPDSLGNGKATRYRDVRYEKYNTVVELDSREAHPLDEAFRDLRRDNALIAAGEQPLRYGWRDVVDLSCEAARQVIQVLRRQGWSGVPKKCGPHCRL